MTNLDPDFDLDVVFTFDPNAEDYCTPLTSNITSTYNISEAVEHLEIIPQVLISLAPLFRATFTFGEICVNQPYLNGRLAISEKIWRTSLLTTCRYVACG